MSDANTIELTKGCYVELNDGRVRGPLTNHFWKGRIQPSFSLEFNHDPELKPGWTTDGKYLGGKLIGPSLYDVKRVVSTEEAAMWRRLTAFCVDPGVDLGEPKMPVYVTTEQHKYLTRWLEEKVPTAMKIPASSAPRWNACADETKNAEQRTMRDIQPILNAWLDSKRDEARVIRAPLDEAFLAGYNAALRNEIRPAIPVSEKPQGGLSDINPEELAEVIALALPSEREYHKCEKTMQRKILAVAIAVRNHLCVAAPGYETGQHPAAVHSIDDEARA
jgi:hypothetical protein